MTQADKKRIAHGAYGRWLLVYIYEPTPERGQFVTDLWHFWQSL